MSFCFHSRKGEAGRIKGSCDANGHRDLPLVTTIDGFVIHSFEYELRDGRQTVT